MSELIRTEMEIVASYVAHPLGPMGPDRDRNIENATDWAAWLASNFGIAPVMPWVVLARRWPETVALRNLCLSMDRECVKVAKLFTMVGGRVSPGMAAEQAWAGEFGVPTLDLTWLGYSPPDLTSVSLESSRALRTRIYLQLCDTLGWEPDFSKHHRPVHVPKIHV